MEYEPGVGKAGLSRRKETMSIGGAPFIPARRLLLVICEFHLGISNGAVVGEPQTIALWDARIGGPRPTRAAGREMSREP